jgi:2-methylcitrate dehydratase PrpD
MMGITKQLAQKCHDLTYGDLPDAVVDRAKYLFLDFLGVAARGALNESSRPVHALCKKMGIVKDGAVVVGTDLTLDPSYAALANGTAAHSIELDDVVNAASLHPAVAVMPTALAAAHVADCTGKRLIEAIVAGYEVTIRLGIALDPSAHYAQGFHPTGTCGTMAAAVTAGKIIGLDPRQMINALGIAGSQAAASMEFLSDGSFTKRLHPGWAAHSGLLAAMLAREGFTGPETIIEGKFGFLHAYSPASDPEKVLKDWADPYQVLRTSIKPHSCCRYKQGPIDGTLKIMKDNSLEESDVESVTLGVLKTGHALVVVPEEQKQRPESIVDAQFSMPFGAAVAILYGKATLDEYTLDKIASPKVKEMMQRIRSVEDPSIEGEFPIKWAATATLKTKDGRQFSVRIEYPKGDPENPLTWDELIGKFKGLAAPVYTDGRLDDIVSQVRAIDRVDDIRSLSNMFQAE